MPGRPLDHADRAIGSGVLGAHHLENEAAGNYGGVVEIPVACSIFPREILPAPRSWAERVYPDLIHWNELDRGQHTRELRDGFRPLR